MVSSINPSLIDINYPIAGVDQPSQGFRDNFSAIKSNFSLAKSEIDALQAIAIPTLLDDLSDVDTTTIAPTPNDVLTFIGGEWVPSLPPTVVVNDSSPQLGGDLDTNNFLITGSNISITPNDIGVGSIELIGFTSITDDNSTLASANLSLTSNNPNAADGIFINSRRSRGTGALPTAVQNGDDLLNISTSGYDGTAYQKSFTINVTASGNYSGSNLGSIVSFQSVATNQTTRQTRLEFTSGGNIFYQNNQAGQVIMSNTTTNGTITELFINSVSGNRFTLSNNSTWFFRIDLVARRTDVDNESAGYTFIGVIDRNASAASTALVGSVTKTVVAEDTVAWDATVDADSTNGSLRIQVTGEIGKTIRWIARIESVQVIE